MTRRSLFETIAGALAGSALSRLAFLAPPVEVAVDLVGDHVRAWEIWMPGRRDNPTVFVEDKDRDMFVWMQDDGWVQIS